jgi:hypothetical protein
VTFGPTSKRWPNVGHCPKGDVGQIGPAEASIRRELAKEEAQDLRANRFDTIFVQRTKKGRNGRMAMRYTIKTINIRPNIPRTRVKVGESWSTNKAGTDVTVAKTVSPIQSSIFSIQLSGFQGHFIDIE